MAWNRETGPNWIRRPHPAARAGDEPAQQDRPPILLPIKALFTLREAAYHCGVSVKTIDKWINEGLLRVTRLPNSYRRVEHADLLEFLHRYRS